MYSVVDKLVCDGRGNGIDSASNLPVFLECSQALLRKPWSVGVVPTILPGSKIANMSNHRILAPQILATFMGIVSSLDVRLVFGQSPRLLADLCGNAMAGWSFGEALILSFSTSSTKCCYRSSARISNKYGRLLQRSFLACEFGSFYFDVASDDSSDEEPPDAKRREVGPSSALDVLLSLG